jgi:hypothetical protein
LAFIRGHVGKQPGPRKRPEVVDARRAWALQLLEFLASHPLLNNHPAFTNFLFDLEDPGDTGSEGSLDR